MKTQLTEFEMTLRSFLRRFPLVQAFKLSRRPVSKTSYSCNDHELINQVEKLCSLTPPPFSIVKKTSSIDDAGLGVFIEGSSEQGKVICLYPGLVYRPGDAVLFQSINNAYLLRCFDGLYVDGKSTGLSRLLYISTYNKINAGETLKFGDVNWLTENTIQYNVGQIVNNHKNNNVEYVDLDIPPSFPLELRKFLPNIHHGLWQPWSTDSTRIVALVSTRAIKDEELFSQYHTIT